MSQDLYAVVSTYKAPPGALPKLLETLSTTPSTGEKFSALSLLTDNETIRGIKIYAQAPISQPTPTSPTPVSVHNYRYAAGFLPSTLPEDPYLLWADVHYKPTSHPSEMLQATQEIVDKVREKELGTLCYLWLQDREDERHVLVFEMYAGRADLDVHRGTEWYSEYGGRLFPIVEMPVFSEAVWKGGRVEGVLGVENV